MNEPLKPCRSPYCECEQGKCTCPGFYDARHEPWPPTASPMGYTVSTPAERFKPEEEAPIPGQLFTREMLERAIDPTIPDGHVRIDGVLFKVPTPGEAPTRSMSMSGPNLQQISKGSDPARALFKLQPYQQAMLDRLDAMPPIRSDRKIPDSVTSLVEEYCAAGGRDHLKDFLDVMLGKPYEFPTESAPMTQTTRANSEIEIRADFDQARDLIQWRRIGDQAWRATPYQVADARHDPERALELVDTWLDAQS